jgi:hypothetical protein
MRGLTIKKLAAVGVGAALLGCSLAPVVSAAVTGLTKSNIVSSTGVPVVDVVAGSNAAVSDWVWAGNIAAKVAQFATTGTDVTCVGGDGAGTCTPTDLTVDLTVGGTTSVSGGKIYKENMYSDDATMETEFRDQNATSTNVPTLTYYGNRSYTYNGTSYSTTMQEKINFTAHAQYDDSATNYALVTEITSGNLGYVLDLGSGIPVTETSTGSDNFDDDTNDNIRVPLFGDDYLVNAYDTANNELELVKAGAEQVYVEGDKIEGLAGKDGGEYTLEVGAGGLEGSTAKVYLALYDSEGTLVGDGYFASGDVIFYNNETGTQILQDVVNIKSIFKQVVADAEIYQPKILVGSDRVLVRDGGGYPYDSTSSLEDYEWVAELTEDGAASGTKLKEIKIKNRTKLKWQNATALKVGEEAPLMGDYGSIKFLGLQLPEFSTQGVSTTKNVDTMIIGGNELTYRDSTNENEHTVPFYYFWNDMGDTDTDTFTFDTKDIWFKLAITSLTSATSSRAETDLNIIDAGSGDTLNGVTVTVDYRDVGPGGAPGLMIGGTNVQDVNGVYPEQSTVNIGGQFFELDNNTAFDDGNWALFKADGNLTFKKDSATGSVIMENWYYVDNNVSSLNDQESYITFQGVGDVDVASYVILVDEDTANSTADVWLLLKSQVFSGLYGSVEFQGTDIDDTYGLGVLARNYYEVDSEYLSTDYNGGSAGGENDNHYKVAKFTIDENLTAGSNDINIWIDTTYGQGLTVDTTNVYLDDYYNYHEVDYNSSSGSASAAWFLKAAKNTEAYTDFGTKITLASGIVTAVIPQERPKAELLVAGTSTTTEVTGGEDLTGLAEGTTGTTSTGTQVTVSAIDYTAGTCVGGAEPSVSSAVVVVPVGELVYSDTAAPAGNHIIVGGHMVNSLADGLTNSTLVAAGDMVTEVTADGDIVVAGYTANDTKAAAQDLIDALDALLG